MRSPRALLLFATLAVAASVASVRGASAQPAADAPSIDIAWSAPDECPPSAELARRVTTRLPPDAAVRARGRVDKRAGRYHLTLEITTASSRGERALDAATCEALASSAAVVIAISAAPTTPDPAPSSSSPPPPPPPPLPPPLPPSDRPSEIASPADSAAPRLLARAHIAGDAGLLPRAAVGGGLAIGFLALRSLSVEAGANLWAPQDGTVPGAPTLGASFALFSADARACLALTRGIELAPCLGIEVARISASGFGAAKLADASALTWGPEALLTGRLAIAGPVSVRIGLGAFVPISRQSFVINAAGTVHRPGAVALRTWAGPEVRF